jgi:hypothetical protein
VTSDIIVEQDERGRVSLARLATEGTTRYLARSLPGGSILLQPAVVMTKQEIESLLAAQLRQNQRAGRPLREALTSRGVKPASADEVETARRDVAARRSRSSLPTSELTAQALERLRPSAAP